MATRYEMLTCYGRNPRTGKKVGSRHRWTFGGCCDFCGRFKDDVRVKVNDAKRQH
jgi:hypothetical protein